MFRRSAIDFRSFPPHLPALGVLIAAVALLNGASASAEPAQACPETSTLVVTELALGGKTGTRWIEVVNTSKAPVSLEKVAVQVQGEVKGLWPLGLTAKVISPGTAVAFGHVPATKAPGYDKPAVLDLGPGFLLGGCKGAVALVSGDTVIDAVAWDTCAANQGASAVWGLDPAYTDACLNDEFGLWCTPSGAAAAPAGSPGKANAPCDLDGDTYRVPDGDCDDQNGDAFPTATEICNGVDDDCDGETDDGVVAPVGSCLAQGVCAVPHKDGSPVAQCAGASGFVCVYAFGYEPAVETLCDGFDNDCDGQTDEELLNACGTCATSLETCNGADDDCDGKTDEDVAPELACGTVGVCALAAPVCSADGTAACALPLSWQATETLCDELDNDCDGETDEALGLGEPCVSGDGLCSAQGVRRCGPGGTVVCDASPKAGGVELCGDGVDNNCDGATDEGFAVGTQCESGLGVCRVVGKVVCASDQRSAACSAQALPAASAEACDNELDDDCDGQTDEEGCQQLLAAGGSCTAGAGPAEPAAGGFGAWLVLGLLALVVARLRARRA